MSPDDLFLIFVHSMRMLDGLSRETGHCFGPLMKCRRPAKARPPEEATAITTVADSYNMNTKIIAAGLAVRFYLRSYSRLFQNLHCWLPMGAARTVAAKVL